MDEPCELRGAAEELVEGINVQPRRRLGQPDGGSIAAVRPLRCTRADARFDGVANDVKDRRDQVGVGIHLNGERSILEQVGLAPMSAICSARVIAVQQLKSC